jgi:parallel beta-helix repeat protein
MTTTTTTKTNHYFRALAALAVLASLLAVLVTRPTYATTTFTVNSTSDFEDINSVDGVCDADSAVGNLCTLRAAIEQANATSGADVINFNIPAAFRDPNTGVATIKPNSKLPSISDRVTIDGYTQPGASPNTKTVGDDAVLKIQLDGTKVFSDNGLEIDTSDGSVISGLLINRFGTGIGIQGDAVANRIEGNFIGTNPTGTLDVGNQTDGVAIFDGPSETVVGGTTLAARNVLSGNGDTGVFLVNSNINRIQGNYVGTDKSGTKDLGNEAGGVFIGNASGTTVGGKTAASRNVISGNDDVGLVLSSSQGTRLLGNRIGTIASGTAALGNSFEGVFILALPPTT